MNRTVADESLPLDTILKMVIFPLCVSHTALVLCLFLLHDVIMETPAVRILVVVAHYILLAIYLKVSLTTFNSTWTQDFNSALRAVNVIKDKLEETEIEAQNIRDDANSDVGSMKSYVDETRKVLELQGDGEALHAVNKLDNKVNKAVDLRKARQYFSKMVFSGFVSESDSAFISFENLVNLINKVGSVNCICELSADEQSTLEIRTHPRCIQLLALNLKAYSNHFQDEGSSYKSILSITFPVPPEIQKHMNDNVEPLSDEYPSEVRVRVKYMGKPLEKEEQINNLQMANYYSKKKQLKTQRDIESGNIDARGTPQKSNYSPQESMNTKILWDNLNSGRDLVSAIKISQIMDGEMSFEKEVSTECGQAVGRDRSVLNYYCAFL